MKKTLIAALAVAALLGFAGSSFALLCSNDVVPAGTLLFPFVTAKYDPATTPTDPKIDKTAPTTYFAITNASSSARIVHLTLFNDFSIPVLDWDVLLTGYDVIRFDFGRLLEGYLVPTGPDTNPATGRPYSPVGTQPLAFGPVPSFYIGIPSLPVPVTVGTTKNNTTSIYGLCTNPAYTVPYTIDPGRQAPRIIPGNLTMVTNAMRQSQRISENGWWGYIDAGTYAYIPPDWLLARSTSDNVWGYITADVVHACGIGFPTTPGYFAFNGWAPPLTTSRYAGIATAPYVDMGNTLIGDWYVLDAGTNRGSGGPAVHIEMDNLDVNQTIIDADGDLAVDYPKMLELGRTFYRYAEVQCNPAPIADDLLNCRDFYTGTGYGGDYTTGATYFFGNRLGVPAPDYREPLPSAFAFRWMQSGNFDSTKIRVWKETPDIFPYYGFTYVYSGLQYAYYAWDEEEHVYAAGGGGCDYSPCGSQPKEYNQLPLEIQEIEVNSDTFKLPTSYMSMGWMLLAFLGSNTLTVDIDGGYTGMSIAGYGTQAWVEVEYGMTDSWTLDMQAAIIGNFTCDGLAVSAPTRNGWDNTDLGDVLY